MDEESLAVGHGHVPIDQLALHLSDGPPEQRPHRSPDRERVGQRTDRLGQRRVEAGDSATARLRDRRGA